MAFSYEVKGRRAGESWGTYTNTDGSTGGDVYTGLRVVEDFACRPLGSSVITDHPAVNETMPLAAENVTIVTAANEDGTWHAWGIQ